MNRFCKSRLNGRGRNRYFFNSFLMKIINLYENKGKNSLKTIYILSISDYNIHCIVISSIQLIIGITARQQLLVTV